MKKLWLWGLLALIGFFMAACSSGGSSNDSPTEEVPTATPDGFTAERLDASPTYYVTYTSDDGMTVQETFVFSGTGPYTVTGTEEYFDANDSFVSSETFSAELTLNQDGTLTTTDSSGVTTVTLTSETSTYLAVNGVEGADTWSDLWYFAKPAGWLTANDVAPTGFTAEMLNDTYYVTYITDDGMTAQETFIFSGTGPYTVTGTVEYFNASDAFQGSETFTADVTLNQDGTLTTTDSSGVTTVTLTSETSTYLAVNGVFGADTWSDLWYLSKPAGWRVYFVESDFAGQSFVEIGHDWTVVFSFGTGTTTGSFNADGSDPEGPWAETGTWTLENGVITADLDSGGTASFALVARDTDSLSVEITDDFNSIQTWVKTEEFVVTDVANKTFAASDVSGQTFSFDEAGTGQVVESDGSTFNFEYVITNGVLNLTLADGFSAKMYKMAGSTASNLIIGNVDYDQGVLDSVFSFSMVLQP